MVMILLPESDEPMLTTVTTTPIEERVVRAAISACQPGGSTYQYFAANPWEAHMRQMFATFIEAQSASSAIFIDDGVKLMRYLNAKYTTRYSVAALPIVYENAMKILHENGWGKGQAPNLFQANAEEVKEIVKVLSEILNRIAQHPISQPYSLLTKWLHFCLPDTFAICDSQAVKSIQMCSDFLHKNLGPRSPTRRQFRTISIYEIGGEGYIGILNFYRLCGEVAQKQSIMDELLASSQHLEEKQHQIPNCSDTRISILDVLDKHFWHASGDAHKLGIV